MKARRLIRGFYISLAVCSISHLGYKFEGVLCMGFTGCKATVFSKSTFLALVNFLGDCFIDVLKNVNIPKRIVS